jgi:hypothetical protein
MAMTFDSSRPWGAYSDPTTGTSLGRTGMGRAADMATDLACIAGLYAFCCVFWPMALAYELLRSRRGPVILIGLLFAYVVTMTWLRSPWAVPMSLMLHGWATGH